MIKNYLHILFFTVFLVCFVSKNQAQSSAAKNVMYIENKGIYGFLLIHHKKMEHLAQEHTLGYELSIGKCTWGIKKWEQLYNYPEIGVSILRTGLGSKEFLGTANAVYPYMNFTLAESPVLKFNFRFGTGLAYHTKKFDRLENYKNIAIGSSINWILAMAYELRVKLRSNIQFCAGVGINHFSNGAFKIPNLGVNIAHSYVSLVWFSESPDFSKVKYDLKRQRLNKMEYSIGLYGGLKEIYPAGGEKFPCAALTTDITRLLNAKHNLSIGFDFFYNAAHFETLNVGDTTLTNRWKATSSGIHIGHTLKFNRFSFNYQVGTYFHIYESSDGIVYNRVGLKYRMSNHWYVNLSLKTHLGKADFIEAGFGYVLFKKVKSQHSKNDVKGSELY